MTQEHPITPPPDELVEQWLSEPRYSSLPTDGTFVVKQCRSLADDEISNLVIKAARWGADQELEASCHEIQKLYGVGRWLRSVRRPKPPSLKEQALAELDLLKGDANAHGLGFDAPAIRRALESLPD